MRNKIPLTRGDYNMKIMSLKHFTKLLKEADKAQKKGIPFEEAFKDKTDLEAINIVKEIMDHHNKQVEDN